MGNEALDKVPEQVAELEKQATFAADVRGQKADLVKAADGFMKLGPKPRAVGDTQFRNLIDVAAEAGSVVEVEAFIKYQIGRDSRRNGWAARFGKDSFGAELLRFIDLIAKRAQEVRPDDEAFKVKLITYFFGYLSWRVKYDDEPGRGRR